MNTPSRKAPGNEPVTQQVVLLVEDEPFVLEATSRILQSAGFEVVTAGDATEAINICHHHEKRFDLLMSDLVLPDKNGRQLGEDVRRRLPGLPILLTSGYLEVESDSDTPEVQIYFLQKPYSKAELVGKVESILSQIPRRLAATRAS